MCKPHPLVTNTAVLSRMQMSGVEETRDLRVCPLMRDNHCSKNVVTSKAQTQVWGPPAISRENHQLSERVGWDNNNTTIVISARGFAWSAYAWNGCGEYVRALRAYSEIAAGKTISDYTRCRHVLHKTAYPS